MEVLRDFGDTFNVAVFRDLQLRLCTGIDRPDFQTMTLSDTDSAVGPTVEPPFSDFP